MVTLEQYLAVPHCQRRIVFGNDVPEGTKDHPFWFARMRHNEPRMVNPDQESRGIRANYDPRSNPLQLAKYLGGGQ